MYSQDVYDSDYGYENDGHTGDPNLDLEYERTYYTKVPDVVATFIPYFQNAIKQGVVYEIQNLYENTWPKISEQYYDKCSWPTIKELSKYIEKDEVFIVLYRELFFRHIHARIPGGPSNMERVNSFSNYCALFNLIISPKVKVTIDLPDIWLWELIDEFVYQFQNWSQYRSRLTEISEEDLEKLADSQSKVWSIFCVLNALHSLVDMSNIKKQLEVAAAGGDPDSVAGQYGRRSFYKMLGYFSLVGLLRVHTLTGDYYQAIKVLEPIEIHKKSQYSHIPACQISTSYYVGFSYMMMRRYSDAIRTFSSILLYIQRTKQLYSVRSYQNDQINKQTEQMFHLLAICLVLHPQSIDESLQQVLRDKTYHESMYKMQCQDRDVFRHYFNFSCPKFVSPCLPNPHGKILDYSKDATDHQTNVFMDDIEQQMQLPTIRSYLKLYTTLPLEKLISFMDKKSENQMSELLIQLLCFKHKMKNIVWTKGGSGLEGKFMSGSELDFYIDNDMIHIADTKVSHRYGDFFIRKILKFEDLNRRLHQFKI